METAKQQARERTIRLDTPESAIMFENINRAMAITPTINVLTLADAVQVRQIFSRLTKRPIHESFVLIPPFYTDHGVNIEVGKNVFINQCCTLFDIGGIRIEDDVMIGPKSNLLTSNHPVSPADRRACVIAAPIVLERNAWIGASVTILPGVVVGENSVVAAGAVVTRDVPPNSLVGGVPARLIRAI